MVHLNPKEANSLVLAYLGDSVWELYIRTHYINKGYNIKNLNKIVKENVNAKAQSVIFRSIYDNLTDDEKGLVNRAKNSNIKTFPKSCSIVEYKEATAFEALIGKYYIEKQLEKIEKIIEENIK